MGIRLCGLLGLGLLQTLGLFKFGFYPFFFFGGGGVRLFILVFWLMRVSLQIFWYVCEKLIMIREAT